MDLIDCYSDFHLSSFVANSANLINMCIHYYSHPVTHTVVVSSITTV